MLLDPTGHSHCSLADLPAPVIVADIARPVAEVPTTAALMRMVRTSSRPQCLLVEARDDLMEPGDAHAEAGTADLRGEVIRDRMLLYVRPEPD